MQNSNSRNAEEVKSHLIDVAGRTTQDLGLGRIVGQVLSLVYLTEHERSLDEIGAELGLSKAAVSIAARQLEDLGLLERIWKKGDRKNYYRTVKYFGAALQHGLLDLVRGKIRTIGAELEHAEELMPGAHGGKKDTKLKFLKDRLRRARKLHNRARQILESPILKLLGR